MLFDPAFDTEVRRERGLTEKNEDATRSKHAVSTNDAECGPLIGMKLWPDASSVLLS
jgi:hypothetical protein